MLRPAATCLALCLLAFAAGCRPGTEPGAPTATGQAAPTSAAAAAASGELAAELEGVPITTGELDAWIRDDLFRRSASSPSDLHDLRMAALDSILEERIVASVAQQRGVSPEELVAQQVAELGPVTDEEVQAFYAEHQQRMGEAELEEVQDRIRGFLAQSRETDAMEGIWEQANFVVHLEPPRVEVAAVGPARGPEAAPITIVEFSDFQCPFCQRVIPTLDEVLEKYPDQVRVVYRNLPLRSHDRARPAAEAALCADEQGQFWPYHDKLFENTRQLEDDNLLAYAGELGLDAGKFKACYEENRFAQQVSDDVDAARAAGISGTPAFVVNGILISGAKPPAEFYRIIDAELERLGKS